MLLSFLRINLSSSILLGRKIVRRRYKSAPAVGGEDIKGHMVMVEKREWVDRKLAPIINVVLVHRRQ